MFPGTGDIVPMCRCSFPDPPGVGKAHRAGVLFLARIACSHGPVLRGGEKKCIAGKGVASHPGRGTLALAGARHRAGHRWVEHHSLLLRRSMTMKRHSVLLVALLLGGVSLYPALADENEKDKHNGTKTG